MKRFVKVSLSLVISLAVIYSVLWFAATTFIKNQIIKEIERVKSEEVEISYDNNIRVSGYPSKIKLSFSKLKINYKKDLGFDLDSDSLMLTSDLLFSGLHLAFGDNTVVKTAKTSFIYDETKAPNLSFKFSKPMIMSMTPNHFKDFAQDLSFVSYNDSGFTLIDNVVDAPVIVFDYTDLILNRDNKNSKINSIVIAKSSWQDADAHFDPVEFSADVAVRMNNDQSKQFVDAINIDKITLKSDQASIALDGAFNKTDTSNNLVGSLNVALNNYAMTLDFLTKKKLIDNEATIKKLLQKIADVDDQARDVSFAIKYDGKSDLTIGTMSIARLIMAYYQQ